MNNSLKKKNKLFIRLSMWDNETQCYLPVGTLIYDNDPNKRVGFVGFVYDRHHVQNNYPAIDPAHLDPKVNNGRFAGGNDKGDVPHYFASFLPGSFSQQLLSSEDNRWMSLSEAEKLYVMTHAHGDFGAAQLNPQKDQVNEPIRDLGELSRLIELVRQYQRGDCDTPVNREVQGALCSFGGPKPKIDFEEKREGIAQRFVVKINTTGHFNDARMAATMASLENDSGIQTCSNRVVSLDCGEDVLFSYNYSRVERIESAEDKDKLVLKYNRISFKTLLADDPVLGNTQRPSYKHIVHAIDKYSDDPVTDKEELFRRAVFSAATNHTSNNLENMEMYDTGGGKWRLSPSFQNLPNPHTDAEFDVSFSDNTWTSNLLKFDEKFIASLGGSFGYEPITALALAQSITTALGNIDRHASIQGLSDNDLMTLKECVKLNEVKTLHNKLLASESIQNELTKNDKITVSPTEEEVVVTPPRRGPGM